MMKTSFFIIVNFLLTLTVFSAQNIDTLMNNAALKTKDFINEKLLEIINNSQILEEKLDEHLKEDQLKPYFLDCRTSFKKVEFILSYLDNPISKRLNGANLITNEYDSKAPNEQIHPHGLQVMEDLIYNPTATSRDQLKYEINEFQETVDYVLKKSTRLKKGDNNYYNLIIWDALKYEIFRIEALGITGFDVPDSENALPETIEALKACQQVISFYKPAFKLLHQLSHYKKGYSLFRKAIQYVKKNESFDDFNRLIFIKDFLHQLSAWIAQSSKILGLVYPSNHRPLEISAKHLFDSIVLNPAFFSVNTSIDKVILGKKLFNDSILSGNNDRSCATCHIADIGFADGRVKNTKLDGGDLKRNTPSLWNAAFQTRQFYDSRERSLKRQALAVIHDKTEMNGNLKKTLISLENRDDYLQLFLRAFDGQFSENSVVEALSCYVHSLKSFNSKLDQFFRDEGEALTAEEQQGFNLFTGKAKCATCHFMPLFNGLVPPTCLETESEILGVPATKSDQSIVDTDMGKYDYSHLNIHKFAFKTPGLRNIDLTAPYMHNGVFETLKEVIDFYDQGGGVGQGMDLPNQTLSSDPLHLSDQEKTALISFMKCLTDESQKKVEY